MTDGTVLLESFSPGEFPRSFLFRNPVEILEARTAEEVLPALRRIEAAVAAGLHAAGFVAYDAAPAFDSSLPASPSTELPLLRFGIYREREDVAAGNGEGGGYEIGEWQHSRDEAEHAASVSAVRERIAAGETYQVNFTFRSRFRFSGDPFGLYRDICRSQRAPFCACLAAGRWRILSASPELFFSLADGTVTARPMKGTAPRALRAEEDAAARERLRDSAKDRAENVMIVDLLRNDLGKVCRDGSVRVTELFRVETLETLHQMTSTVTGSLRPGVGLAELFSALFPCGSITGAPKRRSMEIIRELEESPRGVYTGAIGCVSPGGEALFSVAIRTAVIDTAAGSGEIGIGGGITWDSRAEDEYREALAKGAFASARLPEFRLLETLLHEEGKGCFLVARHLRRLAASAGYFGFACDADGAARRLEEATAPLRGRSRVRLLLDRDGTVTVEASPLEENPENPVVMHFDPRRVDSRNPFLYHKTSHRPLFSPPEAGTERLFLNERGEVTEGTMATVVALLDGELLTPPLASGLLPGVFREELLERGVIRERILTPEDLSAATELFLVNSVRKWRRARLAGGLPG